MLKANDKTTYLIVWTVIILEIVAIFLILTDNQLFFRDNQRKEALDIERETTSGFQIPGEFSITYSNYWQRSEALAGLDGSLMRTLGDPGRPGSVKLVIKNVDSLPPKNKTTCEAAPTGELALLEQEALETTLAGSACSELYDLIPDSVPASRNASCTVVEVGGIPLKMIERWTEVDESCGENPPYKEGKTLIKSYVFYNDGKRYEFELNLLTYDAADDVTLAAYENFDFLPFKRGRAAPDPELVKALREFDLMVQSVSFE